MCRYSLMLIESLLFSLFEETSYMTQLSLERVIVRSVLLQQLIVILAVLKELLTRLLLLKVGVATFTHPGDQVASRCQWCPPLLSE